VLLVCAVDWVFGRVCFGVGSRVFGFGFLGLGLSAVITDRSYPGTGVGCEWRGYYFYTRLGG